MLFISLSLASTISTLAGGLFALRFQRHINLMLAFTAGALLALCGLHLLPEIAGLATEGNYGLIIPVAAFAGGYLGFQLLHHILHRHHDHSHSKRPVVGVASALALASHSFFDGVAIGLAFQVNIEIGIAVALAVIAHDFADGLNAVNVMLAYKNSLRKSKWLLALVSLAPLAGVLSTLLIQIPEIFLLVYLGGFAGFIVYLLAKDILPQVFKSQKSIFTPILLMLFGMLFIYTVTGFTGALE